MSNMVNFLHQIVKTIPTHNMAILSIKLLNKTRAFAISSQTDASRHAFTILLQFKMAAPV
jgi:hypothetical protein